VDDRIWFEDLKPGQRFAAGPVEVTQEAIIRYAAEFDPQPYHLDPEAAKTSPLKGLAASGWHTASIAMKLIVEARPFGGNAVLGRGVDELRWLAPVRPGDRLRLEGEVLSVDGIPAGKSGTARVKWVLKDQRDEAVYSVISINVLPRRP
jgi:acyl dehydratase